MAKARKLPSGNWRVLLFVGYDPNGKRIYESFTAPTAAEANLLANQRKFELENGITRDRTPAEMTIREIVEQYISDRDSILAPKTIREYKGYMRNYAQGIMNTRLKDLTDSVLQKEINKEAKRLSPKSVHNVWGLLSASIKAADPDRPLRVKLPQKKKKEFNIPTQEELLKLFDAVQGTRLEIPVIVATTCGLRRGEIAAIDLKKDVDYKNNTISVTKAMTVDENSEWLIKPPKTFEGTRTVEVPQWVADKLKVASESEYNPLSPACISAYFAKLAKRLGINIRFHDLRHYYASVMLSLGVPDKYAMQRMGHATPNMLKNVYQHIMEDKNKEISYSISNYFGKMQHEMQHDFSETKEKERK